MNKSLLAAILVLTSISRADETSYVVKEGDTLSKISRDHVGNPIYGEKGSLQKVKSVNPSILNPNMIFVGDTIKFNQEPEHDVPAIAENKSEPVSPVNPVETKKDETPSARIFQIGAKIGLSLLSYKELPVADLFESALNLKGHFKIFFGAESRWFSEESLSLITLPKIESGSNESINFFEGDGKLGYRFSRNDSPSSFQFSLSGGVYYLTSWSSKSTFGFRNLVGPEIVPELTHGIGNGSDKISGYFRFASAGTSDSSSLLSFQNGEIALGGSYRIASQKIGSSFAPTIELSQRRFMIANTGININSATIGLDVTW